MSSEAQKRAQKKYGKKNLKVITLGLHRTNDKDIIDYLETKESKNGYMKELIRKDIESCE